jgi:hypothetical protein
VTIPWLMLVALAAAEPEEPFAPVARVLQSPRCMNCHPAGDAPLQHDTSRPHAQNVKRRLESVGMRCSSCHPQTNLAAEHLPPGAPDWKMPPERTPMVFQSRTPRQLCQQLKDPASNGGRTLADLQRHIEEEPLVRWSFEPGPGRTRPPLTHAQFIAAFTRWVALGAPCP